MEIQPGLGTFQLASYYAAQSLLIAGLILLAWRQRSWLFAVSALAFLAFLIGNLEMIEMNRDILEARQVGSDATSLERAYSMWRSVSAFGLLVGSTCVFIAGLSARRIGTTS